MQALRAAGRGGKTGASGGLLLVARCPAKKCPVNVRSQCLACNGAIRLPFDADGQVSSTALPVRDVAKVARTGRASAREHFALRGWHCLQVRFQIHARMIFTERCCRQHVSVNSLRRDYVA